MLRRQRLLVGMLGLVAIAVTADYAYRTWYAQPKLGLERKADAARKQLQELKVQVAQAEKAAERMVTLEQRSLPGDLELARGVYQEWLLNLVERSKLTGASVDSAAPVNNKNLLYRLSFTLRAKGTLSELTAFLYEFYATGFLQKVRSLNLTPSSLGRSELILGVDVLILPQTPYDDRFPPASEKLAFADLKDYRWIAWRNLFGMGGFEQFARDLELTGITSDAGGKYEAWMTQRSKGKTTILQEGESLTEEAVTLEAEEITAEMLYCRIDGQAFQLKVGESVAEAASLSEKDVARDF